MPFRCTEVELRGVLLLAPTVFEDDRGYFLETYKDEEFAEFGIADNFRQDNHSFSTAHVLRGLHYQVPPFAQSKLVRCLSGEIFDVAVDIRKKSETFGRWYGVVLSAKKKDMLYIPEGFAHGFCTLNAPAEVAYKTSNVFSGRYERGIFWNDLDLKIDWPGSRFNVSEKDQSLPMLGDAELFE